MTSPTSPVGNTTQVKGAQTQEPSHQNRRSVFHRLSMAFSRSSITSLQPDTQPKAEKKEEQKATTRPLPPTFQEITSQDFYKQFSDAFITGKHVLEGEVVEKGCVSAVEIVDSVALFGKSDKTLFVYHIGASTQEEIVTGLKGLLGKSPKEKFQLYTIGGDGSESSIATFIAIHAAISSYFNGKTEVQDLMHVNRPSEKVKTTMVTAALDKKAGLFFYRH